MVKNRIFLFSFIFYWFEVGVSAVSDAADRAIEAAAPVTVKSELTAASNDTVGGPQSQLRVYITPPTS